MTLSVMVESPPLFSLILIPEKDDEQITIFHYSKEPVLEDLQFFVGGLIEIVAFTLYGEEPLTALVNEDGRRLQMKHNRLASLTLGQAVVGPCVIPLFKLS